MLRLPFFLAWMRFYASGRRSILRHAKQADVQCTPLQSESVEISKIGLSKAGSLWYDEEKQKDERQNEI